MPRTPAGVFSEKRRLIRKRRALAARCVFDSGESEVDVTLRNISPFGAKIAGEALASLPAAFELRIPDGAGGYSSRSVRLVWSRRRAAGVAFTD